MARRRRQPFNMPEGKYGDYIAKHRLGTPYIAGKPIRTKVKQTPKLIEAKSKFSFFGNLTPVLHSDPKVRAIWESSDIEGENSRHKIMRTNYNIIPEDRDLTNLRIVPFNQLFQTNLIDTVWGNNKVTVIFGPFEGLLNDREFTAVSAHGVVRYYGLKAKGYEHKYLIEKVSSRPVVYKKGEQHTFSMEYDSTYTKRYSFMQLCFTLIIEDSDGIAKACSENIILN